MAGAGVAIIDYGSGNLHSARKAFERAAAPLGLDVRVTSDPDVVRRAERVVLPGVGAFADCRDGLDAIPGMVAAMGEFVDRGRPFLGVCVGMQLLATRGLEHRVSEGLNLIPGAVAAIAPDDPALKIPHMGWNTLRAERPHPLLADIATGEAGEHAYFVHSYALTPDDPDHVVASAPYGGPIVAVVARDAVAGVQFHPEKSQRFGLTLIGNFLRWRP